MKIDQDRGRPQDLFAVSLFIVIVAIVTVNALIAPSRFADYDNYLVYIDSIWYFPSATPIYMEPLSRGYLYLARSFSPTTDFALDLAHYTLGAVYLIGLYALLRERPNGWQALLVVFAITAPLLALVTVRATPAYLLVALAVMTAADRPARSSVYMVLALCFHVSAGLALAPWALLLIRDKLPAALRAERTAPLIVLALLVALLFTYFGQSLISALVSLIEGLPVLNKYMTYAQAYGPQTGPIRETSVSHYIFLLFTIIYTAIYLLFADEDAKKINLYVVASFAIYITLFLGLSPVAAFRQACFWQLPMTVMLPWKRLGVTSHFAPIMMFAALSFFLFQLSEVYE